jgi:hypothetical protein
MRRVVPWLLPCVLSTAVAAAQDQTSPAHSRKQAAATKVEAGDIRVGSPRQSSRAIASSERMRVG